MGGYQMHVGPSLLSADQKYPDSQPQYPGVSGGSGGYASLPPNANLSLVTGIPSESPPGGGNPYYTSLLMLRPPSCSPRTDPSTR